MTFVESVHCPIIWKCHRLNETITVDYDAVYNMKYGWLCKCGHWVKKSFKEHEITHWGLRDGYKKD